MHLKTPQPGDDCGEPSLSINPNAHQTFRHKPVSGTSIRLFEFDLKPRSSNESERPVSGHLRHVDLACAPPYMALSYAWGGQPLTVPLLCDGQKLMISDRLDDALRKLRHLLGTVPTRVHSDLDDDYLFTPTQHFWVDQICIDQSCPSERSHQVTLMGQIYSRAVRTVAWLSGDDQSPQERASAWKLVDDIYDTFRAGNSEATSISDITPDTYSDTKNAAYGLQTLDDEVWHALCRTISLPWFSRTWVIQEVVLSKLDPILIHGDLLLSFTRLGWVASWLRRKGYLRRPDMPRQFQNVDTIANIRRSRSRWPLEVLLTSTSAKFYASDQRDKVYGLLGMAAETQDSDPANWPPALATNYSEDLARVYTRIALFLFSQRQSLVSLTRCISADACAKRYESHGVVSRKMPSWVPQWSDVAHDEEIKLGNLVWITYPARGGTPSLGFSERHRAAKGLSLSSPWVSSDETLSVQALCVDAVEHVLPLKLEMGHDLVISEKTSSPATDKVHCPSQRPSDICQVWDVVRQRPGGTSNGEDLFKTLIRAITADQSMLGGAADRDQIFRDGASFYLRERFRCKPEVPPSTLPIPSRDDRWWWWRLAPISWRRMWWSKAAAADEDSSATGPSGQQLEEDGVEPWMHQLALGGDPEAFAVISRVYLLQRAFIITDSGKLGLGPKETRRGDLVYVIPGGDVPYIVTGDSAYRDKYQEPDSCSKTLVGESWIDGFMAGEAVDAWECDKPQMEMLTLK